MKLSCPNIDCKNRDKIVKDGTYHRPSDGRNIQRFKCKVCGKKFSKATGTLEFGQNKRRVNYKIMMLVVSGVSMRRTAKILNINKNTVCNKVIYLANKMRIANFKFLNSLRKDPVKEIQVDDLITIEHTKCKPLSVSVAVDSKTRAILGATVSRIPAFGHLAKIAKKKYGFRKNERKQGLNKLFSMIEESVFKRARIVSDEDTLYPKYVRKYFPNAIHETHKGERGCVAGQGELKKVRFDPLFSINHTMAMLRANINRLIRRTWCSTKLPEMLEAHLQIYINYHNKNLITQKF